MVRGEERVAITHGLATMNDISTRQIISFIIFSIRLVGYLSAVVLLLRVSKRDQPWATDDGSRLVLHKLSQWIKKIKEAGTHNGRASVQQNDSLNNMDFHKYQLANFSR